MPMDEPTIEEWLDRHHVEIVRTHALGLDGTPIGKYLNRGKFLSALAKGHGIADMALAMDLTGNPHMTFWHAFRNRVFGDIALMPDLDTIISDGRNPDLGHIICDFVNADGSPISLCPRSLLRRVTQEVAAAGYEVKAAFELEFYLYHNSFEEARKQDYQQLEPVGATPKRMIYSLRNAYTASDFMSAVIKSLNWQQLKWESWNDEGDNGQLELNFSPADPVTAADGISRARQVIYEIARDKNMAVTFMTRPGTGYSNGLHIHHSLLANGKPAFVQAGGSTDLMKHWIAGIVATMPGAVSLLCPSINSCRRLIEFGAPPTTPSWAEEDKSAALRVITRTPELARLEHRLAAGDANPYLALATILAGGLAGLRHQLTPPPPLSHLGWALPEDTEHLPNTLMAAYEALGKDPYLPQILGEDLVRYWRKTRRDHWLAFHTQGGDPETRSPTLWEHQRHFELA